jgi:hypothetical protein
VSADEGVMESRGMSFAGGRVPVESLGFDLVVDEVYRGSSLA